ncbi:fungal-specific transcription factor domain-containing protein [Aspergillus californicus]
MSFSHQLQQTTGSGEIPSVPPSPGEGFESPPPAAPQEHSLRDAPALRSCVTCRRRKVRCNKRSPCSNCVKAGIDCIFPPPGRAPRQTKRPHVEIGDVLSRLRQLESIVEAAINNPSSHATPAPPQQNSDVSSGESPAQSRNEGEAGCPTTANRNQLPSLEHEFGRLVVDDDKSRYVSNRLWASLGDEIEELRDILDPDSSDEDDHPAEMSSNYNTTHGMLFGSHFFAHSNHNFHLPLNKVTALAQIYAENVKPVLPIVHCPTAQQLLATAAHSPNLLDKNNEALVFSMFFTVIVSMSDEQCTTRLGEDRATLVNRYRFAVEQALSKANLINTQSPTLLQAFIMFLTAVHRDDETRYVWSMSALALRLAQGLGLHRDGKNFNLKPFEVEMRRRLWWHIILLNDQSCDEHGTVSLIDTKLFDTRLPLNVNDDDISPDMKEEPSEQVGYTNMSLFLTLCELQSAFRRVAFTCPIPSGGGTGHQPGACANVVQTINKRVEERYLKHFDLSDPIQWLIATTARLTLTRMWLVIHHPIPGPESQMSDEAREGLFISSIEMIEFLFLLKNDQNIKQWSWRFSDHIRWLAVAMVLAELCVRPLSPLTDRAWLAVTTMDNHRLQNENQRKGMFWRPLAKLMERAKSVKAKQLADLRAHAEHHNATMMITSPAFTTDFNHRAVGSPFETQFPGHSRLMAAAPPMDVDPPHHPLNFDIGKGPVNLFNEFFPDGNWLATPGPHTTAAPRDLASLSAQTAMSNGPLPGALQDSSGLGPNQQEWDQVSRDYRSDMRDLYARSNDDSIDWAA